MPLENLSIRRACLHEVYRRPDDRPGVVPPSYGQGLLELDQRAMDAFASRVLSAFRSDAQCMEMTIARFGPGTVAALGAEIVRQRTEGFVRRSRSFADLLAEAQLSRQIPGGLVAVFDGTVGNPATRFFGLMKAELHEGFIKQNNLQATFVDSLFLSPKTKLYKIGLFICSSQAANTTMPDDWTAIVYDTQMTAGNRQGAALYFHDSYLGLSIPDNSAHKVKKFFDNTKNFISNLPIHQEEKVDLHNGLYAYLKLDQSRTVQVSQFGERHLPEDLRDDYQRFLRQAGVSDRATQKDLSEVAGRLRLRRLRFPRGIRLQGPPDAIRDLVQIEPIDQPDGSRWTRIIVRGAMEGQE